MHLGEAADRGRNRFSNWPWFACGRATTFCEPTDADVTCMHCAAGIPFKDWRERDP